MTGSVIVVSHAASCFSNGMSTCTYIHTNTAIREIKDILEGGSKRFYTQNLDDSWVGEYDVLDE